MNSGGFQTTADEAGLLRWDASDPNELWGAPHPPRRLPLPLDDAGVFPDQDPYYSMVRNREAAFLLYSRFKRRWRTYMAAPTQVIANTRPAPIGSGTAVTEKLSNVASADWLPVSNAA